MFNENPSREKFYDAIAQHIAEAKQPVHVLEVGVHDNPVCKAHPKAFSGNIATYVAVDCDSEAIARLQKDCTQNPNNYPTSFTTMTSYASQIKDRRQGEPPFDMVIFKRPIVRSNISCLRDQTAENINTQWKWDLIMAYMFQDQPSLSPEGNPPDNDTPWYTDLIDELKRMPNATQQPDVDERNKAINTWLHQTFIPILQAAEATLHQEIQSLSGSEASSSQKIKNNHFWLRDIQSFRDSVTANEAQSQDLRDFFKGAEKAGFLQPRAKIYLDFCFESERRDFERWVKNTKTLEQSTKDRFVTTHQKSEEDTDSDSASDSASASACACASDSASAQASTPTKSQQRAACCCCLAYFFRRPSNGKQPTPPNGTPQAKRMAQS